VAGVRRVARTLARRIALQAVTILLLDILEARSATSSPTGRRSGGILGAVIVADKVHARRIAQLPRSSTASSRSPDSAGSTSTSMPTKPAIRRRGAARDRRSEAAQPVRRRRRRRPLLQPGRAAGRRSPAHARRRRRRGDRDRQPADVQPVPPGPRAGRTPRWRGVTLLHELRERGIRVAVASDNCRDPFYGYGDHDMLEVFTQAARIAHLDRPVGTWPAAVTSTPAAVMRLPDAGRIAPGAPAELVVFNARGYSELLSRPQSDRIVLRGGKPIDTTLPDYRELDHLMRAE
jgi:hypothetical protein